MSEMQPKIIVAVDGSSTSKAAVEWAARDAGLRHAPLTLVHVLPNPVVGTWLAPPSIDAYATWSETRGRKILDESQPWPRRDCHSGRAYRGRRCAGIQR